MTRAGTIPIVDLSKWESHPDQLATELGEACRRQGFFYLVGHEVDVGLIERLETLSRQFFALEQATKLAMRMELGGRAWRGYFPVGDELTSGQPDRKEGIYFGSELSDDDPRVRARTPLHGPNLFPDVPGFRAAVLDYMRALTQLGHLLMRVISRSLGLADDYFHRRFTSDPLILFRIFHYPPLPEATPDVWSVGEHTDYGLLTILCQDTSGGLQVKSEGRWIDATPLAGSFVCNLGDMLELMTGGLYRSTPHRVRNPGRSGRLSFPFFFDPGFDTAVEPIPGHAPVDQVAQQRWDEARLHEFRGTYGDYVLAKVGKVFPELRQRTLND